MKHSRVLMCVIVCLLVAASSAAQEADAGVNASATSPSSVTVPRLIKFSGVLRDLSGKPLAGPVDVTFSIYQNQGDAAPLWQETQTLTLDEQGRYTVLLGAMRPEGLPLELFTSGEARWLGAAAGTLPEQSVVLLVSVPYALKAGDAETLGGKPASAYMLAPQNQTSPGRTTAATTRTSATGKQATLATAIGITPNATISGTQNYIPVFINNSRSMGNSAMYQNGSNVGIGTTDPGAKLEVNGNAGLLVKSLDVGYGYVQIKPYGMGHLYDEILTGARQHLSIMPGGNVGIGTTGPLAKLHVAEASGPGDNLYIGPPKREFDSFVQNWPQFSSHFNHSITARNDTGGGVYPLTSALAVLLEDNSTNADVLGLLSSLIVVTPSGQTAGHNTQALRGDAYTIPSTLGTVPQLVGVGAYTDNESGGGQVQEQIGFLAHDNTKSGNQSVKATYGYYAYDQTLSGANQYGFYTLQGARTNSWAFYGAGSAPSYFGGNVGIGTATPTASLEVKGTAQFDGPVNFASATSNQPPSVAAANVYVSGPGSGIILKSPDGNVCKLLTIDNTGALLGVTVTCP